MSADGVRDIAGCSTPSTREIIVISDDEEMPVRPEPEEVVFRDIFEVPQAAPPALERVPSYRSDEEGPAFDWDAVAAAYDAAVRADEDPDEEWDEEAAAHDAAILDAELEREDEDTEMEDSPASVPESDEEEDDTEEEREDAPPQVQETDDARVVGIFQAAAAEIVAARQDTFQARMDAAAEAQAAAQERHALEAMWDAHVEEEARRRVQLMDQLAIERERVAQLTESLGVARAAAQEAEARLARRDGEVESALRDLSLLVAGFSPTPGQPAHLIRRDTVLRLITGASCRALQRF